MPTIPVHTYWQKNEIYNPRAYQYLPRKINYVYNKSLQENKNAGARMTF
jgi:hypothetical protein